MESVNEILNNWDASDSSKESLLKQLEERNPQLAALYRNLLRQVANQQKNQEIAVDAEIIQEDELLNEYNELLEDFKENVENLEYTLNENHTLQELLEKHKTLIKLQKNQIHSLSRIVNECARALGACPTCCGAIRDCPICHGMGGPGFTRPDSRLFHERIQPAIDLMNWQTERQKTGTQ